MYNSSQTYLLNRCKHDMQKIQSLYLPDWSQTLPWGWWYAHDELSSVWLPPVPRVLSWSYRPEVIKQISIVHVLICKIAGTGDLWIDVYVTIHVHDRNIAQWRFLLTRGVIGSQSANKEICSHIAKASRCISKKYLQKKHNFPIIAHRQSWA